MSNNESKAILYVILSIIICFFCFMKNTGDIQNKIFKNECFNCNEYNYSDYEKLSDSPLYSLNNKNIKNGFPGASMYGGAAGIPYGYSSPFRGGHAHGFPFRRASREEQADFSLKLLCMVVIFFVLIALLWS